MLKSLFAKALANKWLILGAVAAVVVLAVVGRVMARPVGEGFTSDQPASLVLFYSHNCGHCKDFLPKWKEMAKSQGGSVDVQAEAELQPTGEGVQMKEVNCDAHGDIAGNHGIEGVPTMILFKGGQSYVYNGPREEQAIKAFVERGGQ